MPRCARCQSERVVRDAWACFNPDNGLWEVEATFDQAHCQVCVAQTTLAWSRPDKPPNQRIRELNDRLRTQGLGRGTILITQGQGVQAGGDAFLSQAIAAVQAFADFSDDNDPWGEHDFGSLEVKGQRIFFKRDYYADESCSVGSENPANEGMTCRALTVMLAEYY